MKTLMCAIFSLIVIQFDCGTESNKNKKIEFTVKVDSITHSQFGAVGDSIRIKLYGTIGSDGCFSFYRFDEINEPLRLDLTVKGVRQLSSVCPAVMVYLNGKEYIIITTQQGLYSINIHQPDESVLRDSILIK